MEELDCRITCVSAIVGDKVRFKRSVFKGSFRKPKFVREEIICGTIVAESYGADKGQHTFTIQLSDSKKMLIKGRNLYKDCYRAPWHCEKARSAIEAEKFARGNKVRKRRMGVL